MDRLFKLREHGTNVRTEVIAGLTTFMTMAYILFVNTLFLGEGGAGISNHAVFFATAVGAGLVTIAMGFFVNIPIALAPGMGLNAFFAFTVVLGMGHTWQFALTAVFLEGIIFLLLTAFNNYSISNNAVFIWIQNPRRQYMEGELFFV